jgi:hypothetical protein
MNPIGKDSPEVIKFTSVFAKLKNWSDDDSAGLPSLAARDKAVMQVCDELFWAAHNLEVNERRRRQLFAEPVDDKFLNAWRDYEARYQSTLAGIVLSELLDDLGLGAPSVSPSADFKWENADYEAKEQAHGIDNAIDFSKTNAEQDWRWDEELEAFNEKIKEGVAAWERLRADTGLDLQGIFRRRALIPFVLVPRRVAAKYGTAEAHSMLNTLQEAHDTFVFGTFYAALALMRSIMEAVLRDHYRVDGKDLRDRICNARNRLPRGANEAALHRLRKLANAVLHLDRENDQGLPKLDKVKLEKEIVSLLFVLRALIEGVN